MFGMESWDNTDVMIQAVEVTHIGLLRQIMGGEARQQADGAWDKPASETVLWT